MDRHLDALSDGLDTETNLAELGGIQDQASIENEGGLLHGIVDLLVIELSHLELVPLGDDNESGSASAGLVRTIADLDVLRNY